MLRKKKEIYKMKSENKNTIKHRKLMLSSNSDNEQIRLLYD